MKVMNLPWLVVLILVMSFGSLSAKAYPQPRDYYEVLSKQDIEDIYFIIRTLSNKPLYKLLAYKSSLDRAGDRIDHVNPLLFLSVIFSDEELKGCMYNIRQRTFIWKKFVKSLCESLDSEAKFQNVKNDHIHHFSNRVNVPVEVLFPHVEGRRWNKFIKALIEHNAAANDSDRYAM